jgi:lipid-binding SYLF domain-containing protein
MLPIGDDNTAASAADVGGVARVVRVAHLGGFVAGLVLTLLP